MGSETFRTGLLIIFFMVSASRFVPAETLYSPNGEVELTFNLLDSRGIKSSPVYELSWKGIPVLEASRLGFDLQDGNSLTGNFEIIGTKRSSQNSSWKPVYGERSEIRDHYNQLLVQMVHTGHPVYTVNLYFRCYDQGAALRYEFPGKDTRGEIAIREEATHFRFTGNHDAWCA